MHDRLRRNAQYQSTSLTGNNCSMKLPKGYQPFATDKKLRYEGGKCAPSRLSAVKSNSSDAGGRPHQWAASIAGDMCAFHRSDPNMSEFSLERTKLQSSVWEVLMVLPPHRSFGQAKGF